MTEVFYYAYWNGEALSDVFNATAAVFGTGDFSRITSVVVLASLLCVVAFGAIKNEGRAVIRFVAAAVLIWFVFIVPKASVVIYARDCVSRKLSQSHRVLSCNNL